MDREELVKIIAGAMFLEIDTQEADKILAAFDALKEENERLIEANKTLHELATCPHKQRCFAYFEPVRVEAAKEGE